MFYRFLALILLSFHTGWADPFADHNIPQKQQESFYQAIFTLHPNSQITNLETLKGESVDSVFHIYLSTGQDYFARFLRRRGTNLNREKIKVIQAMANIWQGPKFLVAAKDGKSFVTEFIHGRHLSSQDFKKNPRILIEFIDHLKKSHVYLRRYVNKEDMPNYSMVKRAQRRLGEIEKKAIELPHIKQVNEVLNYIESHSDYQDRQIVHNDIRPENILLDKNGKTYLIDWAEITYGHLYDDLGAFAEFFNLNDPMEKKLLKRYFNKCPSSDTVALLKAHRWINGLHRAAFKFRKQLDHTSINSWEMARHSDNKNLRQAAQNLESYLEQVNKIRLRVSLEKLGFDTNISIIERVVLWLKILVNDA